MTIQSLSDESPLAQEVLPSVWAGYQLPAKCPPAEVIGFVSQNLRQGYRIPNEVADAISRDFWSGSIHDFCVQHLGQVLKDEDHAKILKTANDWIQNGTTIRIDEKENDLTKLLAAKVVLNAHQRANHAMSNACFLNEQGMLPQENIFMLQKGISPVFYEKDEFDRSEQLKNHAQGVPEDRLLGSFTAWMHRAGMRYMTVFNQMGALLNDMKYMNALILKKTMESYMRTERIARHRHHPRTGRRSWRGRGE